MEREKRIEKETYKSQREEADSCLDCEEQPLSPNLFISKLIHLKSLKSLNTPLTLHPPQKKKTSKNLRIYKKEEEEEEFYQTKDTARTILQWFINMSLE